MRALVAELRTMAFAVVLGVVSVAGAAEASELFGKVIYVVDGDTIDVLSSEREKIRIRVQGIDAPERRQAFGAASKKAFSELVYGRQVTVVWRKRDRYRRIVGKVVVNGSDSGLNMVRSGFAWHYVKYDAELSPADRLLYADAERKARAAGLGLWADRSAAPPWDFRRH
jgi:endonuclease YncB( thermonuclease family)